jgi:hypothetical protein
MGDRTQPENETVENQGDTDNKDRPQDPVEGILERLPQIFPGRKAEEEFFHEAPPPFTAFVYGGTYRLITVLHKGPHDRTPSLSE